MATIYAAAVRAADSLLRTIGGRQVLLRTPAPAVPDDDGEQLGLATPLFQDSLLAPVVFRRVRPKVPSSVTDPGRTPAQYELLVSVTAVNALAGTCGYGSADALFAAAYGVLLPETDLPGVLLEIQSATWSEVGGAPYLYRLLLRAPLALNT
jgi:hypothetical protein